jgi:predicted amidohydrolase
MRVRVAAVQQSPGPDKAANLDAACELVRAAAAAGAQIIALQEIFYWRGDPTQEAAQQESFPGPTTARLANLARELQITLVGGSILETIPGSPKAYNTCGVWGPDGALLARYRKIHLFGIHGEAGRSIQEGDTRVGGTEVVCAETPLARLGLSICYDLRFPELYRALALAGAHILCVPAAFLMQTGKDHWEVLLRARAIETQCFVLAPNCIGTAPETGVTTYGRSLIIDPWGTILAQASDAQGFICADLDLAQQERVRAKLPTLPQIRLVGGSTCTSP